MLTGRHVLIWFLSFFAVVFAVNGIFAYLAISTFSGLDIAGAYQAGRTYDNEITAAAQQAQRAWIVTFSHETTPGGALDLKVAARDAEGQGIAGLKLEARFKRPALASLDQTVPLHEVGSGLYRETFMLPQKGQWILELDAYRNQKRLYRTRNRVLIK